MIRVSNMRLIVSFVLIAIFLLAPFAAVVIAKDVSAGLGQATARIPGAGALLLLGFINLVVAFGAPSLMWRIVKGSRKDALLVPAAFAVVGTIAWLAVLFFLGGLENLDQVFAFAHGVTLFTLLVMVRVLLKLPLLSRAAALAAAVWMAYKGVGGAGPLLVSENQSYLSALVSQLAAFSSGRAEWAWGIAGDPVHTVASIPFVSLPLFVVASLIGAAGMAWWVQRRYFPGLPSASGQFRAMVIWVAATHLIWLGALFAAGILPLIPRGLPVMTAIAMVLVSSARYFIPILVALSKPRDVLDSVVNLKAVSDDPDASAQIIPPSGMTPHTNDRVAWIISMTGVSGEPRVLRQAEALTANGWRVVVCGFDGKSDRPKRWHFIRMPSATPFSSSDYDAAQRIKKFAKSVVRITKGNPAFGWAAHWAHSSNPLWYHIRKELIRVAREHPELRADLVIAHDYHTADIGYDIARVYGAKYSIDVHEYAREQYSNDPEWVKNEQPVIVAVQDYYLRRADLVTVVCAGISELLAKESPLKRDPVTIRNVPFPQPQAFRPTGPRIRVLYHGDLSRHRYIHDIVKSLPSWRADMDLVLRGSGDPAYIADLKRTIAASGLESRVFFEPAVPFDQIVPAANSADIGLFSYEAYSPQIRLALPNKLFEYIMAGLAVCITKLDEAGRVVQQYGVGKLIPQHSPASIAETINSFTHEEIDAFKRASLKAAEELNWDAEKEKLISAYQALYPAE